MSTPAVHWYEGMFLRPHHMQAATRNISDVVHTGLKWDLNYNWGLRDIDIDRDALGNHRFVVHTLRTRLRDGTLVRVPEDGQLPAFDLRTPLQRTTRLTLCLAVPVVRLGKANVAEGSQALGGRYRLDSQQIEDENTGLNPQPIQIRRLNLRLVASTDDLTGFEVIELARVEKSSEADTKPQLDRTYIPPLLSCDAWQELQVGILQSIYDRIGQKIDLLAGQVESRGIGIDSAAPQDMIIVAQLRALNEAYALLGVQNFAQGVHPLPAYLELCRLVGQLSIFGEDHRPPKLPQYDHDNLGHCFYSVKQYLDGLLNRIIEPEFKQVPFEGQGLRMQVNLQPAWLESAYQLFVGVKSQLQQEECVNLLTRPGQLDMKLGSGLTVDKDFLAGRPGLRFAHTAQPPRALPRVPGLIFFQINREGQPEQWLNVQKSLTLALRLNENLIEGNIEGQRELSIRAGRQSTKLQFTLFIVRAQA